MFTATFPNGGVFLKKIFQILKDDIPDAVFTVGEDGIAIQSMDQSHVALVNIFIHSSAADSYECQGNYDLNIRCDTVLKVLNCAPTNGTCIISYDDTNHPDIVKIVLESASNKKTFEVKLLTSENNERVAIPDDMDHQCSVMIDTEELQRCIKDVIAFSEDVTIVRNGDLLSFRGKGTSANASVDMTLRENFEGTLSVTFSLKYLSWFSKAALICSEATLAFDKVFPLLLHFQNDIVDMKFFLAPKMNEDESAMDE